MSSLSGTCKNVSNSWKKKKKNRRNKKKVFMGVCKNKLYKNTETGSFGAVFQNCNIDRTVIQTIYG